MITAIYENGVFRPTTPVRLPEGSTVRVQPVDPTQTPEAEAHRDRLYELLSLRFDGGESDVAARHDEHQP